MNNRCPDSSELLSLALGQVSERRRKTLEAHLGSCATCQQEHTALVQLRSAVRERTPQVPDGLAERTWRTLPMVEKPRRRWRPLAIGTGTAALAGILALTLLPGTPIHPTPAFAQVKQAMDKVNTATWKEAVYFTRQDGKEEKISDRECWAQVSSAQISYREKGDTSKKDLMIVDGEHMWDISLKRRQWRLLDAWRAKRRFFPSTSAADLVRQEILFPRDPAAWQERMDTSVPAESAPHMPAQSAWKMERDGDLLRFRMQTTIPSSSGQPVGTETVWVNPDTYRIVRRERIFHISIRNVKKPYLLTSRKVCDNYRYDITPPVGVFTVPVPEPGTPYVFANMSQKQKPPSTKEVQAVLQTVNRAASAWNRKDASGFLACWDWNNYSLSETARTMRPQGTTAEELQRLKNQWRTAVITGAPFPQWEILRKRMGIYTGFAGVYTRSRQDSPFPPLDASPSNLAVNGNARVTDSQGQRWRVYFAAQLQRQPNGEFRLTTFVLSPRRLEQL
ncbi:MAG: hypothetical protein QM758_10420 [Armatimonas sp.]